MRKTIWVAPAKQGMEPKFVQKDAKQYDNKQQGNLKHEDRKDRKHEGVRDARPERPQPAEGKDLEKRDEEQGKKIVRDEEQDKTVVRDEEQDKTVERDEEQDKKIDPAPSKDT